NQLQSPLLRLPQELRDQIYGYFFKEQSWEFYNKAKAAQSKPNAMALLRTCRQLYAETATIPYKTDSFSF
ncbi:hypothetical protein CC80DRAFT_385158, partial [Byssothecium circinans]